MFVLVLHNSPEALEYRLWGTNGPGLKPLVKGKITGIGRGIGEHIYSYGFGSGKGKSKTGSYEEAVAKIDDILKLFSQGYKRLEGEEVAIGAVGYLPHNTPPEAMQPTALNEAILEKMEHAAVAGPENGTIASDLDLLMASTGRFTTAEHIAIFEELMAKPISPEVMAYPIPLDLTSRGRINKLTHGPLRLKSILENVRSLGQPLPKRIVVCDIDETTQVTAVKGESIVASTHEYGESSRIFSGTDCGAVNPRVIKAISRKTGLSCEKIIDDLLQRGGARSAGEAFETMGQLTDRIRSEAFTPLLQMFIGEIIFEIAGLVALLGGIDLLVISGRIGTEFAPLRTQLVERLHILRLSVDESKNEAEIKTAADITGSECKVKIIVACSDRDRQAAVEIMRILDPDGSPGT